MSRKPRAQKSEGAPGRNSPTRTGGDPVKPTRDAGRTTKVVSVEPVEYVTGPIVAEIPVPARE